MTNSNGRKRSHLLNKISLVLLPILLFAVFAQFIQSAHGKVLYGMDALLSNADSIASTAWPNHGNVWLPGWLDAINNTTNTLFLMIGPGDFLIHHAIALGLHVTTLICVIYVQNSVIIRVSEFVNYHYVRKNTVIRYN